MHTHRFKTVAADLSATTRWLALVLLMVPALSVRAAPAEPVGGITVDTTADELDGSPGNGYCSLREAITNANNNDRGQADCSSGSGADTVRLPDGTYTLTGPAKEDLNVSGDLDIRDDLTIKGGSAKYTIIQAGTDTTNGVDRVLHIPVEHTTVEINDVTIRYGKAPDGALGTTGGSGGSGGGIRGTDHTALTLNRCKITYNRSGHGGVGTSTMGGLGGNGGGIYLETSSLIMNDAVVAYNQTGMGGDGDAGVDGGWGGLGAGMHIFGVTAMTLTNTTVRDNTTGDGADGSDAANSDASSGGWGGAGGGIYIIGGPSGGEVTLNN
jgi:CSLREA domain-containing protein